MLKKNDKRRQHYVPKFYLRNFSENNKSVGIYLFNSNKIIEHGSINDNLWEEYFYGDDAKVEDKLAEYESKWNNIISYVIKAEILPVIERDLTLLRYFILISSARTLKCGNQINNDYTMLIKNILEIENPELFGRLMSSGEFGLSVKFKYPALPFINIAQKFLPLVIDLKMDLLINRSTINYVTSDNPVVFYNQLFQEKNLSRGYGWGEYGIQFIIPVSPRIAICMYDSEVYEIKEKTLKSDSTINKLNELFLDNSDKLLVFMASGDNKEKNENLNYINNLIKKREYQSEQYEECNLITFRNIQITGKHDMSDIFEIKQKFKEMKISNHSEEEINQKLNVEIEKLFIKWELMTEDERQALLKSKKDKLLGISFDDLERPWVKIYNKYKKKIMALLELSSLQ